MKTILRILVVLELVSVFGCLGTGFSPGSGSHFSATLVMAKAPALNEPVVLTTTVTSAEDMRVNAYFNLFAAKAEILSGVAIWSFDLTKDVPAVFTTTMRFTEPDRGHLVIVNVDGDGGYHTGASVQVYVTRTGGTFNIPISTPGPRMLPTPTSAPQGAQGTWRTLMTETFEGVFPSAGWAVSDLSNDGYERLWDDDENRAFDGSWAAWPARGGAQALTPPADYPNNMDTRMAYGPFDLSDAIDATVNFWLWRQTEAGYDQLCVEASVDGVNFVQLPDACWDGDMRYWQYAMATLQPYAGERAVWVGWRFHSDFAITAAGPWIDDLSIDKRVAAPVTIHGRWMYSDRRGTIQPVRYARVDLYNDTDNAFTYLSSAATASGRSVPS